MKKFILAAILAVVAMASASAPVTTDRSWRTSDRNTQSDGRFAIAQRYCPNGRC